jgi:hypothetical protein
MKLCYSAALAAAWLLLYPPWSAEKHAIDPEMPVSRWYEVGTFDSLADCEANKAKVLENVDKRTHNPDLNKIVSQMRLRPQAQCVSEEDPKLKNR